MINSPCYDKLSLDYLEKRLTKASSFKYSIGMLVWNLEQENLRICTSSSMIDIDRPCLSDFATVGCLIQEAWIISEQEKLFSIACIKETPTINFSIDCINNSLFSSIEPPAASLFFSKAMSIFCLDGLSSMSGLSYLVDVFECVRNK